jgi:hypothetical protein
MKSAWRLAAGSPRARARGVRALALAALPTAFASTNDAGAAYRAYILNR